MDNSIFFIGDAAIKPLEIIAALVQRKIKFTRRTDPKVNSETLMFSLPVGPHKARWLFRINLTDQSIVCSGGVTKTFFGHNVWVFRNEAEQLQAITNIVPDALRELDGLVLPAVVEPIIQRAELTFHHDPAVIGVSKDDALRRIDTMQMALLPNRYSNEGRNHTNPGTVRIGKTKSSRAFRSYDPASKFGKRPNHIPVESWDALCGFCRDQLRAEFMFNKRELKTSGLDKIEGWEDAERVGDLVKNRYARFGLSVNFRADQEGFTPESVRAEHPTFVNYARHFFSNGDKGAAPNPRSGATPRYKKYMLENGFEVDVPFDQHKHLVHGLHEVLRPDCCVDLPPEIRSDQALFGQWWNRKS